MMGFISRLLTDGGPVIVVLAALSVLSIAVMVVKAIQFIESTFGISIPDSDIDPTMFATPRSIAEYVERRRGDAPAGASQAVPAE